jgi:glucose-1-phosphate cytidylyltransferase
VSLMTLLCCEQKQRIRGSRIVDPAYLNHTFGRAEYEEDDLTMVSKAVILAGGLGTRLSEETEVRPKPMVEIGGRPIIWHIMKMYSAYGINEFIICLGYKGYVMKEYFSNYYLHMTDVTFDIGNNTSTMLSSKVEPWTVTLVDTGINTMTGGRLKRIGKFLGEEPFCLTYGDAVAALNIEELIKFHEGHGKAATVTAVRPPARFGALSIENGLVRRFEEKPIGGGTWINGGFFVLSAKVLDLIAGDDTVWEREPLEGLVREQQLVAFQHEGFWQPMDTLRDKRILDELCARGRAPWQNF